MKTCCVESFVNKGIEEDFKLSSEMALHVCEVCHTRFRLIRGKWVATVLSVHPHERTAGSTSPTFRCVECGSSDFYEGPCGGSSVNFCCVQCGARYNDMVFGIQQMDANGDEREYFSELYGGRKWTPRSMRYSDERRSQRARKPN